jgi:two-component system, sensor histidine kinase and response regulator
VQGRDYDAVLMDIQMPVMDGLEAARRIRALADTAGGVTANPRFANLPIIAMTALAMAQDAEKSRAAGMNDHVTKPIAPERLMATLAKWVQLPAGRNGKPYGMAASAAPKTGELPADLLALSSLNAREGVRRIGGKVEAYRKQLRRFRERHSSGIADLRRLAEEMGPRRAEEYCHALKGVTGTIGAHALYEKIAAIDGLLKQGSQPTDVAFDEAETLLQKVMREIDGLAVRAEAEPLPTSAPLAPDALRALLARLRRALEYDLGAAEPLLAELRAGTAGTPAETEVASVAALVDVFDIDAARAKLEQLEATQPDTTP